MAENNQRDVDRLVADLSVSSTRSSRVRMVPAGGHFAQGDGAAAPAPTTVGGAAAGRRFRQRTAMDEEEPRPAGARFADSRPAGARFASAHVDEGHVDDDRPQVTRPAGSRFSSSSGAFGPVSSRVPAVPKHGAPEKPDAASVTTAAIDISDSHAATEPLSHGSEVLAAPKPADTAEFTAAATAAAATRSQAPAAEPSARAPWAVRRRLQAGRRRWHRRIPSDPRSMRLQSKGPGGKKRGARRALRTMAWPIGGPRPKRRRRAAGAMCCPWC